MSTDPTPTDGGQGEMPPPDGGQVSQESAAVADSPFGSVPEDLRGYIDNKQWKSPLDAVQAYKNLEGFRGVPEDRLLKLPSDPADMGQVWDKLGRPEAPDKYTLAIPEDMKDGVFDNMAAAAHEAGLTDTQFQSLQGRFAEVAEGIRTERAQSVAAEFEGWKTQHPQDFQNVRQLTKAAGISEQDMEAAMGGDAAAFYSALAKVASRMGEQPAPGTEDTQPRFGMTAAQAMAKVEEMNADPAFQERLNSDDKNVRLAAAAERRKFYEIASRGGEDADPEAERLRRENARLQSQIRSGGVL